MRAPALFSLVLVLALPWAAGCEHQMIPGTNIEDTDENRAVIDFMEVYRSAIQSREADRVLELVAEEYFEDNGTEEQKDDYGLEKLRTGLSEKFEHTEVIQLSLTIQHIDSEDDTARIRVYYRFLQRALLELPAGNRWVSSSDVNRLVLRRKGDRVSDGFLIVSGL